MIKFGFNTIAMLTEGLGINRPFIYSWMPHRRPKVEFADKPWGIDVVEKTSPVSFDKQEIEYAETEIDFKD